MTMKNFNIFIYLFIYLFQHFVLVSYDADQWLSRV